MNLKNQLIVLALVAGISAGITRYYFPQVEFKNTEVTKEIIRNDVRTVVKEVVRADGSKEIVTETIDKSTKKETSKSETIKNAEKQYLISVGARVNVSNRDIIVYEIEAQRRILGPFYIGGKLGSDKSIGVSVGMEF